MAQEIEGIATFTAPHYDGKLSTWYKIVGDLSTSTPPILVIHGGPGADHKYMLPVVAYASHGYPVIFYDQIGNGKSTRLAEKLNDKDFWNVELFDLELNNLIDHLQLRKRGYHVLGQSWGGMVAAHHAVKQPAGLQKLILAGGPASIPVLEEVLVILKKGLPKETQEVLDRGVATGNFESDEYQAAEDVFFQHYGSTLRPWPPKEMQAVIDAFVADPTVRLAMYGPSELVVTGALKGWDITPQIHNITAPTLVINGRHDEVHDLCVKPFFDSLPRVKWAVLEKSAHFTHIDEAERFNELVLDFLR